MFSQSCILVVNLFENLCAGLCVVKNRHGHPSQRFVPEFADIAHGGYAGRRYQAFPVIADRHCIATGDPGSDKMRTLVEWVRVRV